MISMQCPHCQSQRIRKNGHRRGKQNHRCVDCGRQFVGNPSTERGYSNDIRQLCLRLYVNGMGFRGIERSTGVHHTTVINWVRQAGESLPDTASPETIPDVGELDELETFVGSKKQDMGVDCGRSL